MDKIGKRIMIIGSPGSGKSTFSKKLAKLIGIPLIHLDKEFWNYGWVETPREKWIKKQEKLVQGDTWIIDGNYGGTLDIRLEKADTVICFQLNRTVCVLSYLKRVITNINKVRSDMGEGCQEKLDFEFIKYIWNFNIESEMKKIEKVTKYRNKQIIIFKKRSEAEKFLNEIGFN
ncbi:DNA topology modulation protein [Hathewaya histolytica]|uniref:Topology modulation protein n=1 Tax=Hathewaya histolytica TaxID=1498 RepID=A0A4U9RKW1_HATHI|nr:DNA topology modulation protein [Hathewaya histolytica]VTQ91961.1 topology modulation protein [Hathewaya histolytica]